MLDDPVLDVLMIFQAVATLLLALQVHSLSKRSSTPLLIRERTQKDTQEDKPEEPKLSETDEYLHWLTTGGNSESKPVAKPAEQGSTTEQKETQTIESVRETSIMPRGKSEPFNPEALTGE